MQRNRFKYKIVREQHITSSPHSCELFSSCAVTASIMPLSLARITWRPTIMRSYAAATRRQLATAIIVRPESISRLRLDIHERVRETSTPTTRFHSFDVLFVAAVAAAASLMRLSRAFCTTSIYFCPVERATLLFPRKLWGRRRGGELWSIRDAERI